MVARIQEDTVRYLFKIRLTAQAPQRRSAVRNVTAAVTAIGRSSLIGVRAKKSDATIPALAAAARNIKMLRTLIANTRSMDMKNEAIHGSRCGEEQKTLHCAQDDSIRGSGWCKACLG